MKFLVVLSPAFILIITLVVVVMMISSFTTTMMMMMMIEALQTTFIISSCDLPYDEEMKLPSMELNYVFNSSSLASEGTSEGTPCRRLEISNKNVRKISFSSTSSFSSSSSPFFVTELVIKDSIVRNELSIVEGGNVNFTTSVEGQHILPSLTISNVTFDLSSVTLSTGAYCVVYRQSSDHHHSPSSVLPTSSFLSPPSVFISNSRCFNGARAAEDGATFGFVFSSAASLGRTISITGNYIEANYAGIAFQQVNSTNIDEEEEDQHNNNNNTIDIKFNIITYHGARADNNNNNNQKYEVPSLADIEKRRFEPTSQAFAAVNFMEVIIPSIIVADCHLFTLVNILPRTGTNTVGPSKAIYFDGSDDNIVSKELEFNNNTIQTTSGSIWVTGVDIGGNFTIGSNSITCFADLYETGLEPNGVYSYKMDLMVITLHFSSLVKEESSSSSAMNFYLIHNHILRIARFHRRYEQRPYTLIYLGPKIDELFSGGEFVIANNNFTVDCDKVSPAFYPIQHAGKGGNYAVLSFREFSLGRIERVLVTKNHFRVIKFFSLRGFDVLTAAGESLYDGSRNESVFELSENTFDVSTKTSVALNTDWKKEFEDSTDVAKKNNIMRTLQTVDVIYFARTRNCPSINISSNVVTKTEFYRPLVFSTSYSLTEMQTVGFPASSVTIIRFGDRYDLLRLFIINNTARHISFEGDRTFYNSIGGISFRLLDDFSGALSLREITVVKNDFKVVDAKDDQEGVSPRRALLSTFSLFASFDDFPFLDSFVFHENSADASAVSFVTCSLCAAPAVGQALLLLRLFDATLAASLQTAISVGSNPFSALALLSASGSSSTTTITVINISVHSNVFTTVMPSAAGETQKFTASLFTLTDSKGVREKEVSFENNTINVVVSKKITKTTTASNQQQQNFFLPSLLLNIVSKSSFSKISAVDNKHIFVDTSFGTANSFNFVLESDESGVSSSSSLSVFDVRRNQLVRKHSETWSKHEEASSSSLSSSFYKFLYFSLEVDSAIPQWEFVEDDDDFFSSLPPSNKFLSIGEITTSSTSTGSTTPSSLLNNRNVLLTVSDNFVDMMMKNAGGGSRTDNMFVSFNKTTTSSDSFSSFNNISITNNIVHLSQDGAQTCGFVSGLENNNNNNKNINNVEIRSNQINFTKCEKTSSILNATIRINSKQKMTMSNNEMQCGSEGNCLFASINNNDDGSSSTSSTSSSLSSLLKMKANQISVDTKSKCDDEESYFKFYSSLSLSVASASSSLMNLDVNGDDNNNNNNNNAQPQQQGSSNCNTILYRNEETRILNVSVWNSSSSPITINDENCQNLTKCSQEKDRRDDSSTKTLLRPNDSPPRVAALLVTEDVNAVLVTSDVVQGFTMGAMAIGAASTPSLGFYIGRQQSVLNYAQASLNEDCRGLLPATKIPGEDDDDDGELKNPLGVGDSPTRMQIGDSVGAFYVGACVGNFILFCSLILLNQLIGHLATKIIIAKYFTISPSMKFALKFSKSKRKEYQEKQTQWKNIFYVFSNSYVSLCIFFLVAVLLSPTLTATGVLVGGVSNDDVPLGIKFLCVLFAFIIAGVGIYFIVWSLYFRHPRREQFRVDDEKVAAQAKKKELGAKDLFDRYFEAEGSWKIPVNGRTKKETWRFQVSEPCYEGYRDTQWFALVEITTSILICFPPLFAQFASSGKFSCIVQGSLLFFILLVYTILLIWKSPNKLRVMRIVAPIMAIKQVVTVGMILIGLLTTSKSENEDDPSGENQSWLWRTILVPLGLEAVFGIISIASAVLPLIVFINKLRKKLEKAKTKFKRRDSLGKTMSPNRPPSANAYHHEENDDDREMSLLGNNNNNNNSNNNHSFRRNREERNRDLRRPINSPSDHHHHHHHHRDHRRHSHHQHQTRDRSDTPNRSYDSHQGRCDSRSQEREKDVKNYSFRSSFRNSSVINRRPDHHHHHHHEEDRDRDDGRRHRERRVSNNDVDNDYRESRRRRNNTSSVSPDQQHQHRERSHDRRRHSSLTSPFSSFDYQKDGGSFSEERRRRSSLTEHNNNSTMYNNNNSFRRSRNSSLVKSPVPEAPRFLSTSSQMIAQHTRNASFRSSNNNNSFNNNNSSYRRRIDDNTKTHRNNSSNSKERDNDNNKDIINASFRDSFSRLPSLSQLHQKAHSSSSDLRRNSSGRNNHDDEYYDHHRRNSINDNNKERRHHSDDRRRMSGSFNNNSGFSGGGRPRGESSLVAADRRQRSHHHHDSRHEQEQTTSSSRRKTDDAQI